MGGGLSCLAGGRVVRRRLSESGNEAGRGTRGLADDEVGGLGVALLPEAVLHFTYTHAKRVLVACHTYCAYWGKLQTSNLSRPLSFLSSTHLRSPLEQLGPPTVHYGLAQYIQQRPKHHAKLPERRQCSAAIRHPSKLADVWAMGRLLCCCPTSQRISS